VSQTVSPSTGRRYGRRRTCQALGVPRSTLYAVRARGQRPQPAHKRGPKTAWTDAELTAQIRDVLTRSPFVGEGYRKIWARLRIAGIRTSKGRVLRLMRVHQLLALRGRATRMAPKPTMGRSFPHRSIRCGGPI